MMPEVYRSASTRKNPQGGFSIIELMVVVAITITLTAATIIGFRGNKRAYAADDEAGRVLSFFREAHQRALSQRQAQRITIDRQNRLLRLADMGTLPGGDEMIINRGILNAQVTMVQPSIGGNLLSPPSAPYNYPPAAFDLNGSIDIYFLADGSVTNAAGYASASPAPVSLTLFFAPTAESATSASQSVDKLIRAVTLYGPTASAKFWRYDSTKFTWEVN